MIQNAAARLVFNEPKKAHVTPLFISLHWLPVAARIKFKTLMLVYRTYRTTTGSAPTYFYSLLRIYIPSRSLRSASERRLKVQGQGFFICHIIVIQGITRSEMQSNQVRSVTVQNNKNTNYISNITQGHTYGKKRRNKNKMCNEIKKCKTIRCAKNNNCAKDNEMCKRQ